MKCDIIGKNVLVVLVLKLSSLKVNRVKTPLELPICSYFGNFRVSVAMVTEGDG